MKKRTNWIFECPIHGIEEGLLCYEAYKDENVERWIFVEYAPKKLRRSKEQKQEWLHIMKNTRRYHGTLPA